LTVLGQREAVNQIECNNTLLHTYSLDQVTAESRTNSESNLGTDNFDAEMVEAALVYHRVLAPGRAKG
jgi:hypothetical protein